MRHHVHQYPARLSLLHPRTPRCVPRRQDVVVQRNVEIFRDGFRCGERRVVRFPGDVALVAVSGGVVVPARYANDFPFSTGRGRRIGFRGRGDDFHIPHCGITEEAGALFCEVEGEAGMGF